MSLTCTVCLARYSATMIASPTATSAAATVMMKEHQHLRVVVGRPAGVRLKRENATKREVCGVEHQLQAHEDDEDVAPQHHPGETDGEQQAADETDNR